MANQKSADLSEKAQALFAAFDQHVQTASNPKKGTAPKPVRLAHSKE